MSNQCFIKYKNHHAGKSLLVFATGPSLKLYLESDFKKNNLDSNFIKIGCNSALKIGLDLDYYFIGDPAFTGFSKSPESFLSPKARIQKFCRADVVPHLGEFKNQFEVYQTSRYEEKNYSYIPSDIVSENINQVGSISMDMMQFALYCGFKNIFLVGQDCNYFQKGKTSHFGIENNKGDSNEPAHRIIRSWKWIKAHATKSFPETKIYIINPVSLKIFPEAKIEELLEIASN